MEGTETEKGVKPKKGSSLRLTYFSDSGSLLFMSRPLRIEFPGAWYHAMNRGRRRERVYEDDADYLGFVALLQEAAGLWDVRIGAFCLMANHYHLLIHTPYGEPLPVHAPH